MPMITNDENIFNKAAMHLSNDNYSVINHSYSRNQYVHAMFTV